MIGELLYVVFARYLFGLILLVVIGFFTGAGVKSAGARIAVWIIMFLIVFVWVSASDTMEIYNNMSRAGLISDGDFVFLSLGSVAFLMTVYSFVQWFGSASRNMAEQEENEKIDALSLDELLEAIELTFSITDVCILPWVQNKWNVKSSGDKVLWVKQNQENLKEFVKELGGFDEVNRTPFARSEFIVEVQRLDRIYIDKKKID